MLVERFTCYHRRSYVCKTGVGDVLIGAAATIADYNGVEKASHIRDKLVEMTHLNETIYGTGIAASYQATRNEVRRLPARRHARQRLQAPRHALPYEIGRLAQDLAGGLMVTMPSEKDLRHPEIGRPSSRKYLKGRAEIPTEDRMRILRLIENMTLGRNAVGLPHRVHARRRLPAGAAHPDRARHADRVQETARQDARRHRTGVRARRSERGPVDVHGQGLCAVPPDKNE